MTLTQSSSDDEGLSLHSSFNFYQAMKIIIDRKRGRGRPRMKWTRNIEKWSSRGQNTMMMMMTIKIIFSMKINISAIHTRHTGIDQNK